MNAPTITLYGIPNCDTVKKARAWLAAQNVPHAFHDFKKAGVSAELITAWLADIPLDTLVNRKGTTWRGLSDQQKAQANDAAGAIRLMIELPSLIKRPVLAIGGHFHCGFSDAGYQRIFADAQS